MNGVPFGCSFQVAGDGEFADDTLHFNTNAATDNGRFTTGEFAMICKLGN